MTKTPYFSHSTRRLLSSNQELLPMVMTINNPFEYISSHPYSRSVIYDLRDYPLGALLFIASGGHL